MLLLAALAVLIAILIFRNQPPQAPPPPTGGSGSPPPPSGRPSPQSGSPQSGPAVRIPVGSQSGSPSASSAVRPARRPGHRRAGQARRRRAAPRPAAGSRRRPAPALRGTSSPRRGCELDLSRPPSRRVPRLVATDLDGTFLSPDGTVSEQNRAAVAPPRRPAVPVLFATGRPVRWLDVIQDLPGAHPTVIASNGAVLYDLGAGQAARPDLPRPRRRRWTAVGRIRGRGAGRQLRLRVRHPVRLRARVPTWPPDAGDGPGDLLAVRSRRSRAARSSSRCWCRARPCAPTTCWTGCGPMVGDTLTATHSADAGLRPGRDQRRRGEQGDHAGRVCARLGIDAREVAAFGDMPNDVDMLSWAGMPHVVANAHPAVLALDFPVVPSNDESGVGRTIMGWLGPGGRLMTAAVAEPPVVRGVASAWLPVLVASTSARPRSSGAPRCPGGRSWSTSTCTGWPDECCWRAATSTPCPARCQFLYPPFAALLAVPLAVLPRRWCRSAWTVAGACRAGRRAAPLRADRLGAQPGRDGRDVRRPAGRCRPSASASSASSWSPWWCWTSRPDRGCCPARLLPEGVLTGLAAAIKLTPAIFLLYLLLAGKRRAFLVATLSAAGGDPGQRGRSCRAPRSTSGAGWPTATPDSATASSTTRTSR